VKKTITVNISGYAFTIEEEAFDKLRGYLTEIRNKLTGQTDVDEILTDIENRIAELFRASITSIAQIVTLQMVQEVVGVMGAPDDYCDNQAESFDASVGNASKKSSGEPGIVPPPPKRLYRDVNNRVLGGVCSGLGAYMNFDTTLVRVLFVVSLVLGGFGVLVYIGLWIAMPPAETMAQRHEMMGGARTAAKGNDAQSSGFQYKPANDRFVIGAIGRAVASIVGAVIALVGLVLLSLLSMVVFWNSLYPDSTNSPIPISAFFRWLSTYFPSTDIFFVQLAIAAFIGVPLVMMVYAGIRLMLDIQRSNRFVGFAAVFIWLSSVVFLVYISVNSVNAFKEKELPVQSMVLPDQGFKRLYLEPMATDTVQWLSKESDDLGDIRIVLNHKTIYARKRPSLVIVDGDSCRVSLRQTLYFHDVMVDRVAPLRIEDLVLQSDSVIRIKAYFDLLKEKGTVARNIEYTVELPQGYSLQVNPLLKKYVRVE
jgi:phage shock protein PspC (stress-responsive transcriptional regulator)